MRDYRHFNGADPGTAFTARDQHRMYWRGQMRFDRMFYPEGDVPLFGAFVIVVLILLYLWFTTSGSDKVQTYDHLETAMKESTVFKEELQQVYQNQEDILSLLRKEPYRETSREFRMEVKDEVLTKLTNTLEFSSKEMTISVRKDYRENITCFTFVKKGVFEYADAWIDFENFSLGNDLYHIFYSEDLSVQTYQELYGQYQTIEEVAKPLMKTQRVGQQKQMWELHLTRLSEEEWQMEVYIEVKPFIDNS